MLLQQIRNGAYDAALTGKGTDGTTFTDSVTARKRARAIRVTEMFRCAFGSDVHADARLFSVPGRMELGGNHTDHQSGHVLCGSVHTDMLACAAENGRNEIRVLSEGYPMVTIRAGDFSVHPEEKHTTAALVRGVTAGMAAQGYPVGGFDACIVSDIKAGSGLSSSAAFEVLIAVIINSFFCDNALDVTAIARIAQQAENLYFGKPSGMMDQIACAAGGITAVDFRDPQEPAIRRISCAFSAFRHALCLIETGSEHAGLTKEYAAIPYEMHAVAACFGKTCLREVPERTFRENISDVRRACGDRAVLRAFHYYADDRCAQAEAEALACGQFDRFLSLADQSGRSSALWLQNARTDADPRNQPVLLALFLARDLLGDAGAVRVHGGGFAGTVQAFVPFDILPYFREGMEAVFGPGACLVLDIRRQGGCMLSPVDPAGSAG